jgi:hypothetical protein
VRALASGLADSKDEAAIPALVKVLHFEDAYAVQNAARSLGRLRAVSAVRALCEAFDESYETFRARPHILKAMSELGPYHDKVIGLCEGLWMIGDATGLAAARQFLERHDQDLLLHRHGLDTQEQALLYGISSGKAFSDDYVKQHKDARLQALPQKSSSRCFVATAAYDNCDAPEVLFLRNYRDQVLVRTASGRFLVAVYEVLSPPLAWIIQRSPKTRKVVLLALNPAVRRFFRLTGTESQVR